MLSQFSDFNKDLCIGGSDCSRFCAGLVYFVEFIHLYCTSGTNKWTGSQAGSFQMNMTWIIYTFCSINQCNLLEIFYQVWSTRFLADMNVCTNICQVSPKLHHTHSHGSISVTLIITSPLNQGAFAYNHFWVWTVKCRYLLVIVKLNGLTEFLLFFLQIWVCQPLSHPL